MSQEVVMCEFNPAMPATMRYRWPWDPPGEWKPCSSYGQALLRQKAERLKRQVEFLPLVESNPEARPLQRSERQSLHAARLAAEDELKDEKERATRLYNQTVELSADIRAARRECEELKSKLLSEVQKVQKGEAETARLNARVVELTDQLQKANRLVQQQADGVSELDSVRGQLNLAQGKISELSGELNAEREKNSLQVAELKREIEGLKNGG